MSRSADQHEAETSPRVFEASPEVGASVVDAGREMRGESVWKPGDGPLPAPLKGETSSHYAQRCGYAAAHRASVRGDFATPHARLAEAKTTIRTRAWWDMSQRAADLHRYRAAQRAVIQLE